MNFKRTATIVVVCAVLAAWLAGAATSNRALPPPIITQPQPIELRGAELATEIARLHERLRPNASPRQPGRNLFAFRATHVRPLAAPIAIDSRESRPALVEAPAVPAAPPLKLAGIAEDAGPDGPQRTAIVSGLGQLFMVKEGDNLTPRYRVAKISDDVVELTDLADGSTRRIALR
jgi:hypothetical protein